MKVILLQDVAKTGRKHEVAEVPNGYALNRLIPKGLAKAATSENLKSLEREMEKTEALRATGYEAFARTVEALASETVTVKVEANQEGGLFAALSTEHIAAEITKSAPAVKADMILIEEPIKTLGQHTVYLVNKDERSPVTIAVEALS